MSLKLLDISKSYGDRIILDRFNLEFRQGSITCLFGPSGCGKTTILHLMGGIIEPDSGSITGFGEEKISYIFQEIRIIPWKTVLGNVVFPLLDKMPSHLAYETARKFIRLVGLVKEEDYYPSQLSGGMRQRISIARAFAFPGTLILMDEAFQSLDHALKYGILDAFLDIWKDDRRTVIFVTHDIGEASRLGQEIVFMNQRPLKIVHTATTKATTEPELRQLARDLYNQ